MQNTTCLRNRNVLLLNIFNLKQITFMFHLPSMQMDHKQAMPKRVIVALHLGECSTFSFSGPTSCLPVNAGIWFFLVLNYIHVGDN